MNPILADAIDIPVVLGIGLVVLIPLLLFQVFAEAFVLSRVWELPRRVLRPLTLRANVYSLLAGIPTKIVNAVLYEALLSHDLSRFFSSMTATNCSSVPRITLICVQYFGASKVERACSMADFWRCTGDFRAGRRVGWRGRANFRGVRAIFPR